jgi:periplasmic divalent cation tolerance protein
MAFTPRLVLVTASNSEEARRLADAILGPHLAACVNIVPGIESHYWWQAKRESSSEVLLLIKSSGEQFESLAEVIRAHHSYDCPEIVSIAPGDIAPAYRIWWEEQIAKRSETHPDNSV